MRFREPTTALLCGSALVSVLSGCLSKPPSHEQLVSDALPAGTAIPPAWIAGGNLDDVANDWLATFHDAGLDAVVAEALANNLDLRAAAERVEVARQGVIVVGSQLQPQVGIDAGIRSTRDDGNDDWQTDKKAMLGIAWEPDVWGKVRAERAAAEADYAATALAYAYARQSLAALTGKSWYLTTAAVQLLSLSEDSVRVYSQLLDLVRIRRTAGKVSDLEVAEASGNLNAAENHLRKSQGLVGEAKRTLELLVGRYPSAEVKAAEQFTPLPPPLQTGLPSSLLERRPDLVAAEQQVLAAFREQEAAELALLPSFSLGLDGGRLSDTLLSVLQVNPWMISGAVGMHVPIYTGGALLAQVEITTAEQLEAVSSYGNAALRAFREVENALMYEVLLPERFQFLQTVVRDNTEAVRIAKIQYEAGSIDLLSVLQLQEALIASQAEAIELRADLLLNRIELHLALGGSFEVAPAASVPSP